MFNRFQAEKRIKEKELEMVNAKQLIMNEDSLLRRKLNNEVLSNRYRKRVSKFVINMASSPVNKFDEYNNNWKLKNSNHVIPDLDKRIKNIDK